MPDDLEPDRHEREQDDDRLDHQEMVFGARIVLPSANPIIVTPTAHIAPPITLNVVNDRTGIPPTPAIGFENVRTIGMKRASTIVFAPYLSK